MPHAAHPITASTDDGDTTFDWALHGEFAPAADVASRAKSACYVPLQKAAVRCECRPLERTVIRESRIGV